MTHNPLTDLVSTVVRDGRTITVIQPGGRIARSKNWRLNEDAFRRYESHLREAIDAWPRETKFAVPAGMSPNTFEHRLRDALQALKLFGYEPGLQTQLAAIREELTVSQDTSGTSVWIRARQRAGRPIQMHTMENERPNASFGLIHPNPTEQVLKAYCILGAAGHRSEPIQFRGRIDAALIDTFQQQYDTAFAYDEATDVTTMI